MASTWLSVAVVVFVSILYNVPSSLQGPVNDMTEPLDVAADESTAEFGQRITPLTKDNPKRSNKIQSRPPGSTKTIKSTAFFSTTMATTVRNHILEEESSQVSSLLTGEPITVNKSEGACAFDGRVYRSGESIERKHLCHFCFCRNGYIDCYWKNCPPPPEGCLELSYDGVCERSLYLCPIPKKTKVPAANKRRSAASSRLFRRQIQGENYTTFGCDILGVHYRVGELVGVATDPCLECRCAREALYCSPKCCFQPVEPDDDVSQQLSRSDNHRPVQSHPLLHLRGDFAFGRRRR